MRKTAVLLTILVLAAWSSAAEGEWKEVSSREGRCRARFPGTPTETERTLNGLPTKRYSWTDAQNRGIYTLIYFVLPESARNETPQQSEQRVKSARDTYVNNASTKLLSEKPLTLDGKYKGLEMLVESAEKRALMRIRLFVVGDRIYSLTAVGRKELIEAPETQKFFDSFELLK
jgi:hypothetical protein